MLIKSVEDEIIGQCPDFEPDELTRILALLDRYYLLLCTPSEIANHLNLSRSLTSSEPVKLRITEEGSGRFKVVIVAYDYFSAFSITCGLLSAFGLNIEAGSVQTISKPKDRKKILDLFHIRCPEGSTFAAPQLLLFELELKKLFRLLEKDAFREARKEVNHRLIAKTCDRQNQGAAKPESMGLLTPVQITFDHEASKEWTILKIEAKEDLPSFLYAFANALTMRNIYIHHIKIEPLTDPESEEAQKISIQLYISSRQGKKITRESDQKSLEVSAILIKQFVHFLRVAPEPMKAITRFDQFLDKILEMKESDSWLEFLKRKDTMHHLAQVFGTSDFLWEDFLRIRPRSFLPILEKYQKQPIRRGKAALNRELRSRLSYVKNFNNTRDLVNHYKDEEMFRIDMCHLLGPDTTLHQLSTALTDLAELVLETAYRVCNADLKRRYGRPGLEGFPRKTCAFSILGFGKLGGRELGYASDIELLFVYAGRGLTKGPEVIYNSIYFEKLAQKIIDFIVARREGIFAVDTRLRPYGQSSRLAIPLTLFKSYYTAEGRSAAFERQALIKLRRVAGNQILGKDCESARESYVYSPESWDAIDAIMLRQRQRDELVPPGQVNVKYSKGGLIDIEYLTQYLQIIHGTEHPTLRTPNTLQALKKLGALKIISTKSAQELSESYCFLRLLIDALRIVRGNAKDLLLPPRASDTFIFLSRRMGYREQSWQSGSEKLAFSITRHMSRAEQYYHHFIDNYSVNHDQ